MLSNTAQAVFPAAYNYSKLMEMLSRERDRSQLLLALNNILVSNLDMKELLSATSACLQKVMPHDAASLCIYDESIGKFRMVALEFPEHGDLFSECELIDPEGTPLEVVLKTRKALAVSALDDWKSCATKRYKHVGIKSAYVMPLISHSNLLGTLSIVSRYDNAFSQEDRELLDQIAVQISIAVENAVAFRKIDLLKSKLEEEKLYLEQEIRTVSNFEGIIGSSNALKRVLKQVETVAQTSSTVLIYGETGTGKELIARAIHNLSPRRDRTMVKVNCGAIPSGLLESEMFGHEKGAFTGAIERRLGRFEMAHQGTIFLDEIEDIPLELQSKLLRVLQEQEFERLGNSRTISVDSRIIAATNMDLEKMVEDKKFRSDLYYRFNVFPIELPPLRERPEDIPMLVQYFVDKYSKKMKKQIDKIPAQTMKYLTEYHWPGNIRELQNLIERAAILAQGPVLEIPYSDFKIAKSRPQKAQLKLVKPDPTSLESVERDHILKMLSETNWVISGPTGAAEKLGMNRSTLNHRMRKLGISRPR